MAKLDSADLSFAVFSRPGNGLVTLRMVCSQEHSIVLFKAAVLISLIMYFKIAHTSRYLMGGVGYADIHIYIVFICAAAALFSRFQIVFGADDLLELRPTLERAQVMVQCDQADAAIEQLFEIVLALFRDVLGHAVHYDYVVVPVADVLKYLAVVFELDLDVLNIIIALEQRKEWVVLKAVPAGNYCYPDF